MAEVLSSQSRVQAILRAARRSDPVGAEEAFTMAQASIESSLKETRVFEPDEEFATKAHVRSLEQYRALYEESLANPEAFWGEMAKSFHWFAPPGRILEWDPPQARWFLGGTTNISYNC